jgi:hypothetical protein
LTSRYIDFRHESTGSNQHIDRKCDRARPPILELYNVSLRVDTQSVTYQLGRPVP